MTTAARRMGMIGDSLTRPGRAAQRRPIGPRLLAFGRTPFAALLVAVLLCGAFLALFLMLVERERRDRVEDTQRDVLGVTASVTDQLTRALETTDVVLLEIARAVPPGDAPWSLDGMAMQLNQLPHLRAVFVTDGVGRVRFATVPGLVGTDVGDRPWMPRVGLTASRLVVGQPEPGRFLAAPGLAVPQTVQQAGRWSLPVVRPIVAPGGTLTGAVVALMNPDYLTSIGHRAAEAFQVEVRFHAIDGTPVARWDGATTGIGIRNPAAWLFRDFLPRRDYGVQFGEDSEGVPALAGFAVTTTGGIAVEVSRTLPVMLQPLWEHAVELGIGIGFLALSTVAFLLLVTWFGRAVAQQQAMAQLAESQLQVAEREAALLRGSRAETERLLGCVPTLVFHIELPREGAYRYRRIGGNVEAVTGWHADIIEAPDGWARIRAPEPDAFDDFLHMVREQGRAEREFRLRQPDGSGRWLRTIAMVIDRLADGTTEIVGYSADVTAERQQNARLSAAGRLASLGEMATGLAHELRQPLTIMSLAAQNLQKALVTGRTQNMGQRVERIVEQAARAGNIIEHLRRFARGTDEGAPPQPTGLDAAVEGAMTLVGGALRDAQVELVIDIGPPAPTVMAHIVGLEQVLVNLMMNACHALETRPQGMARRINLSLAEDAPEGCARLLLADTGGGIAPEVMARLFEPFVTTKGLDKGTGLGLSICHGLINAMGGTISARNGPDGAIFIITLKRAVP